MNRLAKYSLYIIVSFIFCMIIDFNRVVLFTLIGSIIFFLKETSELIESYDDMSKTFNLDKLLSLMNNNEKSLLFNNMANSIICIILIFVELFINTSSLLISMGINGIFILVIFHICFYAMSMKMNIKINK